MVGGESLANEQPAASPTIAQLVSELTSRPDFSGVVAWKAGEQWQWRGFRCNHGLVFLNMASHILLDQPVAEAPPAAGDQPKQN
jgi:hypothetical protein